MKHRSGGLRSENHPCRLDRNFFDGPTQDIARKLLGCVLVRKHRKKRISGIIVEVEAYLGRNDPASHSARGPTRKNRAMFLPGGHLYVYSIHTRYCLNVVTESPGVGSAVLIRALEPLEGLGYMMKLRGSHFSQENYSSSIVLLRALTSGPGRLCQAFHVDRSLDRADLCTSPEVWLEPPPQVVLDRCWRIASSPRIGISQAVDLPLRWFIDGHRLVSGRAADHSRGRTWSFSDPMGNPA